jgi:hypothetical protein
MYYNFICYTGLQELRMCVFPAFIVFRQAGRYRRGRIAFISYRMSLSMLVTNSRTKRELKTYIKNKNSGLKVESTPASGSGMNHDLKFALIFWHNRNSCSFINIRATRRCYRKRLCCSRNNIFYKVAD